MNHLFNEKLFHFVNGVCVSARKTKFNFFLVLVNINIIVSASETIPLAREAFALLRGLFLLKGLGWSTV